MFLGCEVNREINRMKFKHIILLTLIFDYNAVITIRVCICIFRSLALQQQPLIPITPDQFITDYAVFAVVITVMFGILGFPSLLFGIPACYYAFKVHVLPLQ